MLDVKRSKQNPSSTLTCQRVDSTFACSDSCTYKQSVHGLCSCFTWWVKEDLTWFAAMVELTRLVQLTEMSGTSNSGYFVCLLWKGCLNGSLVTNSTWRLTPIYPHFLSRVLHSCLPPVLVSSVFVSLSHGNTVATQCVCALQQMENVPTHDVQLI